MIKQPLFGQDSSPHKTSTFLSAVITAAFWLIMTITGAFIKIKPAAPKYKEVQIVLSSKSEASEQHSAAPEQQLAVPEALEGPAVVEQQSVVVEQQSVVPEALEGPAPKATPAPAKPKTQTQAKPPAPKKTETPQKKEYTKAPEYEYAKSVEDQMAEQFNRKPRSQQYYDDMFNSMANADTETETNPSNNKVLEKSGMSGEQGKTVEPNQPMKSSSKQNQTNEIATEGKIYSSQLDKIAKAAPQSGSSETKTPTNPSTKSSESISLQWSDGSTREQLRPKPRDIKLSSEAQKKITHDIRVKIQFQVHKDGNVFNVDFVEGAAQLDESVRKEIVSYLMTAWAFEPASTDARATFEYIIKVK